MGKSKGTKEKGNRAQNSRCRINLNLMGLCLPFKFKSDDSETKSSKETKGKSIIIEQSNNTNEEMKFSSNLRSFSFEVLKEVTKGFNNDNIIGRGGFGCVFKGWLNQNYGITRSKSRTDIPVAVKILNHDGLQGHREWLAEVNYLGELIHPNVVKLIGYCIEGDQRLLVYEFMARGSLENHLFRRSLPLPWTLRLKIVLGAAKGLAFLHEEADRTVIFRDFKTSNILLDSEYNAKLSDFGLAKDGPVGDCSHVSTRVMGTYGYAAPEYIMTGHLTTKSDVYSFGVVLLELLTGRKSIENTRRQCERNLVEWARPILFEERSRHKFYKLMDPRLQGHFSIRAAHKAIHLAAKCLSRDPKARPLMTQVVETLMPLVDDDNDMPIASPSFHAIQASKQQAHHYHERRRRSNNNNNGASTSSSNTRSLPNSPFRPNYRAFPSPSPVDPTRE